MAALGRALWVVAVGLATTAVPGWVRAQGVGPEVIARPPVPTGEIVLDGVVTSMELEGDAVPRFALRSEYDLLLRVELLSRGAPDALHVAVHASVGDAVREQLMGEQLCLREAERAGEGDADPGTLAASRAALIEAMHGEAALRALLEATGATADEFAALVRRRVVAEHYLVTHVPRLVEPTETDLRQGYEGERYRTYRDGGVTFAAARRPIRDDLVRAQMPSAVRQYLHGLGSRVRVRVFTDGLTGAGAVQEAGGGG